MSQPKNTVLKIGMLGDVQTGKTSLMVKYVKGKFDEDYIQTLGVQFLEKTIEISKTQTVTFMIWDLGGQKDFMSMLDLVCNDSVALFFIFDLTKIATLSSIRDWYVQSRKYNKNAIPFLIGTKYDKFVEMPEKERLATIKQARKFAKVMKGASLVFCSSAAGVNVKKIFKLVMQKVFGVDMKVKQMQGENEPIIEYTM